MTRLAGSGAHALASSGMGAVVLGGDHQGLGVVRSLGWQGMPVCVIDDELSIARFSRYAGQSGRCDLSTREDLVPYLLDLAREEGMAGWVLFPTRDETVEILSQARAELAEFFRVPTPGWACVQQALDKRLTYQCALRLGIPIPRTWYLSQLDDVSLVDGEPPFVVKPAKKLEFVRATKVKAWRAESVSELHRLIERAAEIIPVEQIMVQELVPGGGQQQLSYCAFFKEERPVASMVVRRLRQHPAEFGRATTYATTIPDPGIVDMAEAFLREMRYYGLVEVEFKHDERDGRMKLLDVNTRTWGYHALGQAAGVDFPVLLFADLLDLPVQAVGATVGVSWVRLVTDVPTALQAVGRGTLRTRDYARSVRGAATESVFTRDDVVPALAELALVPYLAFKRGF